MSFWQSGSGAKITGEAKDAFSPEFTQIPEGTTACASLYNIEIAVKDATDYAEATKFYQLTWKLTQGEFVNRQVTQKIKCFDGTPEAIDRNLNMLKLLMDLCQFKPMHNEAPTEEELRRMCGKILGIKIGEWSIAKRDGSGVMEGNFVREIYAAKDTDVKTGVKSSIPAYVPKVDSAFSRNPRAQEEDFDDGIPF